MRKYEFTLSVPMLLLGLYSMSPLYLTTSDSGSAALGAAFETRIGLTIAGAVYTLIALFSIVATLSGEIKRRQLGMLFIGCGYIYISALRLLTIGPRPIMWAFTLAMGVLAFYVRNDIWFVQQVNHFMRRNRDRYNDRTLADEYLNEAGIDTDNYGFPAE
jgi:hypothetical protein